MSSKSWLMSFIWFFRLARLGFSLVVRSIISLSSLFEFRKVMALLVALFVSDELNQLINYLSYNFKLLREIDSASFAQNPTIKTHQINLNRNAQFSGCHDFATKPVLGISLAPEQSVQGDALLLRVRQHA